MTSPTLLHARLLGPFQVSRDGQPIRLSTRKTRALIAFLATCRNQTATREQVAGLLWGGFADQQARQSLRQALVLLRKELGSATALLADNDVIRLAEGAWLIDACELERLAESTGLEQLQRAADLYEGEFLSGLSIDEEPFEEWVRSQRQRHHEIAGRVVQACARLADGSSQGTHAIAAVDRMLALDPLREDWHRVSLELHARYHGRGDALARAKAFDQALQQELGADTELATRALVAKIERGDVLQVPAVTDVDGSLVRSVPATVDGSPAALATSRSSAPPPAREHRQDAMHRKAAVAVAILLIAGFGLGLARELGLFAAGPPDPTGIAALKIDVSRSALPATDPWAAPPLPSHPVKEAAPTRPFVPIVVLPFTAHGDDAGPVQLTADMLCDDLIDMLSRVPPLRLISGQTSRSYAGRTIDAAAIGAELGVRYLLAGEVRASGDKLWITVQLVDPPTRTVVWSTRIERGMSERHAIHDEIVGRLARQLQFEIYQVESRRASQSPDEAELIYKGWAAIFRANASGRDALGDAEKYFNQALERNPQSIPAITGLGAYHTLIGANLFTGTTIEHFKTAETLLRQAIGANPKSASPHFYLGVVRRTRGDLEGAIESFEQALSINPSDAPSYAHIGHTLLWTGRANDAVGHLNYALRLSPRDASRSAWLRFLGEALLELGRKEQAIVHLLESYALNPRAPLTLRSLAAASALLGHVEETNRYLAELKTIAPQFPMHRIIALATTRNMPELERGLKLATNGPSSSPDR